MRRTSPVALGLDVLCVVVFVAIGRATHDHGLSVAGLASTAWPFLVGLALGWVIVGRGGLVGRRLGAGIVVWASTLVAGMVLRAAAGQGVDAAFVVVAACFLGLFLWGWRVLGWWWRRRRRRGRGTSSTW